MLYANRAYGIKQCLKLKFGFTVKPGASPVLLSDSGYCLESTCFVLLFFHFLTVLNCFGYFKKLVFAYTVFKKIGLYALLQF